MTRSDFPYVSQHWPDDQAPHARDRSERQAFLQHWSDRSCGLACVAMILKHRRGATPTLEELLVEAQARDAYCDRGWVHAGLARVLAGRGVEAQAKAMSPDDILRELERGALFIASVTVRLPSVGDRRGGHLVLLHGVHLAGGRVNVMLADPSRWGEHLTQVCAGRLFHSYSGRGVLVPCR